MENKYGTPNYRPPYRAPGDGGRSRSEVASPEFDRISGGPGDSWDHAKEARALLATAERLTNDDAALYLAAAQVHATLSVSAALTENSTRSR